MTLPGMFKAYDVRGRVPDELNESLARRIGWAYAEVFSPRQVVVGRDVRPTSVPLAAALIEGLRAAGVNVLDIGLCATEEIYFAAFHQGFDGGIMVTASHNPAEYNGFKFVRDQARPVGIESGLAAIAEIVAGPREVPVPDAPGWRRSGAVREAYVKHVLGFITPARLAPLKLVVNAGHGVAGPLFDALAEQLPFEVTRLLHVPDGSFPQGVPNPLLAGNRAGTANAVRATGAELGIAWDGDADRCFLFDEQGRFIEGYYIVGLLAGAFLRKHPGSGIVHDPRLVWNTLEVVQQAGGRAHVSRCGHTFIKDAMRHHDAVYGGEMSAHHYFRDFGYCDSGMIPWLLVAEWLSGSRTPLSAQMQEYERRFPVSGELNWTVQNAEQALVAIEDIFANEARAVSKLDGLSMEFDAWRFNVRPSNTEPLVRLNVESRDDRTLMEQQTKRLSTLLGKL